MALPVLSFVGASNAGKTTLIEKLIVELCSRGLRVAVAKQTHHAGFDLDRPGKDSWRFTEAGATAVLLNAPAQAALLESVTERIPLKELVPLVEGRVDIVLAEGFRDAAVPKIEVFPSGANSSIDTFDDSLLAVVSDAPLPVRMPHFGHGEVSQLADYLLSRLAVKTSRSSGTASTQRDILSSPFEESSQTTSAHLQGWLDKAEASHGHLCGGQVLGVRMALRGCDELGIPVPDSQNRLLVFVEIDRCATDALATVTGCTLGKRTLRFLDYGKLAATFLDLRTGRAVRIAAREDARGRAHSYVDGALDRHVAQLKAYQIMPEEELFHIQHVRVQVPSEDMPGRPGQRVICSTCAEGINDGRHVETDGKILCKTCATGEKYYAPVMLAF